MFKTIVHLLVISLLCFLGGYLISAWTEHRISLGTLPVLLQNDSVHIERKIEATVEPLIKKYLGFHRSPPLAKTETVPSSSDKKRNEPVEQKIPDEHLDDLWLVRTSINDAPPYKTGREFIDGTSPYGPPQQFKNDLFNPKDMLHINADPDVINTPPPSRTSSIPMITDVESSSDYYWIQLANFDSLDKVRYAYAFLKKKGYDVGIYQSPMRDAIAWYSLRLNTPHRIEHARSLSRMILENEKVSPVLIPFNGPNKKLA